MVSCHFGQVVSVTSSIVKDPMKCSNEVVNNLNDVILYSLTNGILQTKVLFIMQDYIMRDKSPIPQSNRQMLLKQPDREG